MINYNIVYTEIGLHQRGLAFWTAIICFFTLLYLGSFSYMAELDITVMLEEYPPLLTTGLGMTPELFSDVNLYHGGLVMLYNLFVAVIYAMILAGTMLVRDWDLGTVEFLYTRPVTRLTILLSKGLAFLVLVALQWIIIYLVGVALGLLWVAPGQFNVAVQFYVHLAGFLASLAAGGLAFALAPLFERMATATGAAVALGMLFFMINGLASLYEKLAFLRYLGVYHYASLTGAAAGEPNTAGLLLLAVYFLAGLALAAHSLNNKEFSSS